MWAIGDEPFPDGSCVYLPRLQRPVIVEALSSTLSVPFLLLDGSTPHGPSRGCFFRVQVVCRLCQPPCGICSLQPPWPLAADCSPRIGETGVIRHHCIFKVRSAVVVFHEATSSLRSFASANRCTRPNVLEKVSCSVMIELNGGTNVPVAVTQEHNHQASESGPGSSGWDYAR